jgi:ring-1,2-phenylacetyl-CoA epoxidase subunit PaaA
MIENATLDSSTNSPQAGGAAAALVVSDAQALKEMPEGYQQLVIRMILVHIEGELTGADDYAGVFYKMAPNAYEKMICCQRAAEEVDHYMRGAVLLEEIGVDPSFMLKQQVNERTYFPSQMFRNINTWIERGFASLLGETAVLELMEELADCSYRPLANIFPDIIRDEKIHVAHGYRIVRDACRNPQGLVEAQETLNRYWPMVLDLFGRSESRRSHQFRQWGLRKTSNEELRQAFIVGMQPRLEKLGLKTPPNDLNRQFS